MSKYDDKYGQFFDEYSPSRNNTTNQHSTYKRPQKRSKKRKKAFLNFCKMLGLAAIILCIIATIAVSVSKCSKNDNESEYEYTSSITLPTGADNVEQETKEWTNTDFTVTLGNQIDSKNAILVDLSNGTILARKNADKIIYPASMTKVMTLLVAAERVDSISNTFTMTSQIIDPVYREEATLAGFCPGEEVKIEDLFYGMVLESGAEASIGLAVYIAGSEENFVKLMNDKAKELGLKNTNFCNTSGLHDKNHYTTCREMAIIFEAAIKNDFCRKVLSTEYYTVAANSFHDELKFHSSMFSRMYGTEPGVATILGGKTGYTANSGNCLVSFAETDDKRTIICVTADGGGKYKPIYDCIELYKNYTHPNSSENNTSSTIGG